MTRKGAFGLSIVAGALAGLGQAPFSLVWLSLPGFALAFWIYLGADTARRAFLTGWAVGAGYFALTLFWIVEPFLVDIARHGWMAPFALLGMAGGLALFWGAAGWAAFRIAGSGAVAVAKGFAWIAAMVLAEFMRGHVLTGFPWAMPGYVWSESGMAQLAAIVGPYGLTTITLAIAAGLVGAVLPGVVPRVAAGVAVLASVIPGWLLAPSPVAAPGDQRPVVRLIQPNAPQDQKWDRDMIPVFFSRALDLTAAPAEENPGLVVWPETSLPVLLSRADEVLATIAEAAGGAEVAVGALRRLDDGPRNSLATVNPDGSVREVYDKWHLVPFGEYMPLLRDVPGFAQQFGTGYRPGPGPALIDIPGIGPVRPLICYEAIFPEEIAVEGSRPAVLLQITNDAWFGTISGPYQHLAQARFRAIEQGLPLIRAANTGVSAIIDARGQVIASLPLGQAGHLDAPLPAALAPTLYARTGDWPAVLFAIVLGAATFAKRRRNKD